jgi:hypothetical protein
LLHHQRNKWYWEKQEELKTAEAGQDDSTWLEEHCQDLEALEASAHNDDDFWLEKSVELCTDCWRIPPTFYNSPQAQRLEGVNMLDTD